MKKTLFLLALLLVTSSGFAQDALFGVRTGVNVSNLDFKDAPVFENVHRNGYFIGFFGEYGLSNSIAIAPEIQFSAEGAKERALRIDYIQVPILLKFNIGDKFQIGAGPQIGVKVHEFEDGFKNFAFSGTGGIDFMVTDEIFLSARYTYGLTNIFDEVMAIEAKNSNMQFGVGIKI
jgi:hypothetical protein